MFLPQQLFAPDDPAAGGPTATPPAVPPPAVNPDPKPYVPASALPDDALKARLDSAKKTGQADLLAALGVANADELKAIVDANKAATEAKKSAEQKLAEQALRLSAYESAIDTAIANVASSITPEQKAAVDAIAGTDKSVWLRTFNALASTWKAPATPAPAVAPAPPLAPPPPAAPPPTSAPAPGAAPPPAGGVSQSDPKAIHAALLKQNPILAAQYGLQHPKVYE